MSQSLPHDYDIECTILGSVLFEDEAFNMLLSYGVTSDSFYRPQHALIFKAMDTLHEDGKPIDQLTLTIALRENGLLDQVGGETYISKLCSQITSAAGVETHSKTLRKYEMRRRLVATAQTLLSLAIDKASDTDSILDVLDSQSAVIREDFKPAKKGITEQVHDFVLTTKGNFSTTEAYNYLGLTTRDNKKKVVVVLGRLLKDGVIVRAGTKNGIFRRLDEECTRLDITKADTSIFPIMWPMGIETYAEVMPHNVIILAGESNTGKTAFLLNVVHMNMTGPVPINYFSCEGGAAEMLVRVNLFENTSADQWKVNFFERYSDFADVIRPDEINIIDFLEIHEDFYRVGGMIKDIHDRLRKGIAIIAIQKDPGKDFARGGSGTIEKARLYITLKRDPKEKVNICKIEKAKKWRLIDVNPNGLFMRYKLYHGAKFKESEKGWER